MEMTQEQYKNFTNIIFAWLCAIECDEPIKAYVKGKYLLVYPSGVSEEVF